MAFEKAGDELKPSYPFFLFPRHFRVIGLMAIFSGSKSNTLC